MRSARATIAPLRGGLLAGRFPAVPSPCCEAPFSSSSATRNDSDDEGSVVYREALKVRRPSIIKCLPHLFNTARFIEAVISPVREFTNSRGVSGVFSRLRVSPLQHKRVKSLRINMDFYGKLAEIAKQHLGFGDFVYVSGRLNCFSKVKDDGSGKISMIYKVIVNDLNFVQQNLQNIGPKHLAKFELQKMQMARLVSSDPSDEMEQVDPLRLWQLYFANPHEWWDNRQSKRSPKAPDFVHKDTRESLRIQPMDPPWVKTQIELLDSRRAELGLSSLGRKHEFDDWKLEAL